MCVNRRICKFIFLLILSLSFSVFAAKERPPQISFDGMSLVSHSRSSTVYRKQDIDLKTYNKIILLPCETAFKKNWKRDYNRQHNTGTRVRDKDIEKMKAAVATLFDEIFKEELGKVEGFQLVTEAGPNTAILRPALINLDAHAPDLPTANRVRTYVESAGEGTIYLEFFDSVSGEILIRAIDSRETRDMGYYSWATRVSNTQDTKALVRRWAKKLTEKLITVHKN